MKQIRRIKRKKKIPKRKVREVGKRNWEKMYKDKPSNNITLEEFEIFAHDRYTFLRKIEVWKTREGDKKKFFIKINEENKRLFGDEEKNLKDSISHHILRLAYCKTENLRNWYINQEHQLFEAKLSQLTGTDLISLVHLNEMNEVEQCKQDEIKELFSNNQDPFVYLYGDSYKKDPRLYKVHFSRVIKLVRNKKVILRGGKAYVTGKQLTDYLLQVYRNHLESELFDISTKYNDFVLVEKDRLVPFLENLSDRSYDSVAKQNDYSTENGVTPEDIPELSKQSFPLCMKCMNDKLNRSGHLKHLGRMQFGLFLKGIGLSSDDAIRFWKQKFSKKMTETDFTKNYLYNIKHNYGLVGRRVEYSPYGCQKIIMTSGEDAGCPFKRFNKNNLEAVLVNANIDKPQREEILRYSSHKQYQVACRTYFELIHPSYDSWPSSVRRKDEGLPFYHPNMYFKTSRRILEGEKENDGMIDEGEEKFNFATKKETKMEVEDIPDIEDIAM